MRPPSVKSKYERLWQGDYDRLVLRDEMLTELNVLFGFNSWDSDAAKIFFDALKTNTSIKTLTFIQCVMNENVIKRFVDALKENSQITKLSLAGSRMGDNGLEMLSMLYKKRNFLGIFKINGQSILANQITSLNLADNALTIKSCHALKTLLGSGSALKKLYLHNNFLGEAIIVISRALETNTTLEHLDLSENRTQLSAAKSIANMLRINKTLKSLHLNRNWIGFTGVSIIITEGLTKNSVITGLHYEGNWFATEVKKEEENELEKKVQYCLQQNKWRDGKNYTEYMNPIKSIIFAWADPNHHTVWSTLPQDVLLQILLWITPKAINTKKITLSENWLPGVLQSTKNLYRLGPKKRWNDVLTIIIFDYLNPNGQKFNLFNSQIFNYMIHILAEDALKEDQIKPVAFIKNAERIMQAASFFYKNRKNGTKPKSIKNRKNRSLGFGS